MSDWSFLTNHSLVFAEVAKNPHSTARDIGDAVGITERATHKIINDLEATGYITKIKVGRRNKYLIHHKVEMTGGNVPVRELLVMLGWKQKKTKNSNIN